MAAFLYPRARALGLHRDRSRSPARPIGIDRSGHRRGRPVPSARSHQPFIAGAKSRLPVPIAARRVTARRDRALVLTVALLPGHAGAGRGAGGSDSSAWPTAIAPMPASVRLRLHAVIDKIASSAGEADGRAHGEIGHDFDYLNGGSTEEGICWRGFGEIVAVQRQRRLRDASGASGINSHRPPRHHARRLHPRGRQPGERPTAAGTAVMVFVKLCGAAPPPITYGGFTDIADSKFRDDIVWLAERGITDRMRRDAVLPGRAGASRPDGDVPEAGRSAPGSRPTTGSPMTRRTRTRTSINRVADAGVTRGCDADRYCPKRLVTRGQMASFLARALGLPRRRRRTTSPTTTAPPTKMRSTASPRPASRRGCAPNRFCPNGERDPRPDGGVPPPGVPLSRGLPVESAAT